MTLYLVEYGFFEACGFVAYTWKYKGTEPKKLFNSFEDAERYINYRYEELQKDLFFEETGSKLYVDKEERYGALITPLTINNKQG